MNDLKFAFRQLLKHKGSSLLAVLLLALGIGGTTAVFSVADKVLLNPIPGRNSDRLISLREVDVMHDSHWQVSPSLIEELATHSNLIESLTYCSQGPEEKKFWVGAETIKLRGVAVAPNFFELLELRPFAGPRVPAWRGERGGGEDHRHQLRTLAAVFRWRSADHWPGHRTGWECLLGDRHHAVKRSVPFWKRRKPVLGSTLIHERRDHQRFCTQEPNVDDDWQTP